jgi:capsular polysaccharide biosynthesis protein
VSRQMLDLKRSQQILWRHKVLLGACAFVGLAGNVAHTVLEPQTFTSNTLVVLSPDVNLNSQAVVVDSLPVLAGALNRANLGMSLTELRGHVQVTGAWTEMISIQLQGSSAAWARTAATAVTDSYVAYIDSPSNASGPEPASVFQSATTPEVKPLSTRLVEAGLLGLLFGIMIGIIAALANARNDRRLRLRDDVADAIGVPVIASLSTRAPSDAAGWTTLLGSAVTNDSAAWQLRKVLRDLVPDGAAASGSQNGSPLEGCSVTVLSVASDKTALALGPRLAAFAAAEGVQATLVIGPQQGAPGGAGAAAADRGAPSGSGRGGKARKPPPLTEALAISATAAAIAGASKSVAALRAGAEAASARNLRVTTRVTNARVNVPGGALAVAIGVVDGQSPRVAETVRADLTLLAVTAGAVTAEQLVRVSASAAADGRHIAGILVANPAGSDETTGRVPRLARPEEYRMPTRFSGVVTTESR